MEGKGERNEHLNKNEHGTPLQDKVRIREIWGRFYHKRFNVKSLKLDTAIIDLLPPRSLEVLLGPEPPLDETTEVIRAMPN